MQLIKLLLLLALAALSSCATAPKKSAAIEDEIRAALNKQAAEWNAGNLRGFMDIYAKSDSTRFASGADIMTGWQAVFDRYQKKYGTREAMGKLTFSDIDVKTLAPDSALAFGRWHLTRANDQPNGLFTLILKKTVDGWRIIHDHTSAASP